MEERKKNRMAKERFYKMYRIAIAIMLILTLIAISILTIDYRCKVNALEITSEPAPEIQQVATANKTITAEERDLIERVVAAESRGESLEGQMGVAEVIKNRSTLWNMTIKSVLTAKRQFASPYQGNVSDITKEAVSRVFDDNERVLDFNATHFYSGTEPYWADNKPCRGMIGGHTFVGEK